VCPSSSPPLPRSHTSGCVGWQHSKGGFHQRCSWYARALKLHDPSIPAPERFSPRTLPPCSGICFKRSFPTLSSSTAAPQSNQRSSSSKSSKATTPSAANSTASASQTAKFVGAASTSGPSTSSNAASSAKTGTASGGSGPSILQFICRTCPPTLHRQLLATLSLTRQRPTRLPLHLAPQVKARLTTILLLPTRGSALMPVLRPVLLIPLPLLSLQAPQNHLSMLRMDQGGSHSGSIIGCCHWLCGQHIEIHQKQLCSAGGCRSVFPSCGVPDDMCRDFVASLASRTSLRGAFASRAIGTETSAWNKVSCILLLKICGFFSRMSQTISLNANI